MCEQCDFMVNNTSTIHALEAIVIITMLIRNHYDNNSTDDNGGGDDEVNSNHS